MVNVGSDLPGPPKLWHVSFLMEGKKIQDVGSRADFLKNLPVAAGSFHKLLALLRDRNVELWQGTQKRILSGN